MRHYQYSTGVWGEEKGSLDSLQNVAELRQFCCLVGVAICASAPPVSVSAEYSVFKCGCLSSSSPNSSRCMRKANLEHDSRMPVQLIPFNSILIILYICIMLQ